MSVFSYGRQPKNTHFQEKNMPKSILNNKKRKVVSLQVNNPHKKTGDCRKEKRASYSASLTLEAAFSLTLFLFISMVMIYPMLMIQLQEEIQTALEGAGDEIAAAAGVLGTDENNDLSGLLSVKYAKERVIEQIGQERLNRSLICGGVSGLRFEESLIAKDQDYVDLVIRYQMAIPVPVPELNKLEFVQRCRKRAWTGRTRVYPEEQEGDTVYMTPHGSVYHTTLECRHLQHQVSGVSDQQLSTLRNQNGAIYYSCEICRPGSGSAVYFITPYGNRYHASLTCREILVTIKAVKLSDIPGIPQCLDCSKSGR